MTATLLSSCASANCIHPLSNNAPAYPVELVTTQSIRGESVCLRPIRPEDAEIEQAFVRGLTPEARHFRFFDTIKELSPTDLRRLISIDYDRCMAIIAVIGTGEDETEIGVARYAADTESEHVCEFAIVIADDWEGSGLAAALMEQLITAARARSFVLMYGDILHYNMRMLRFVDKLGFRLEPHPDEASLYRAVLKL